MTATATGLTVPGGALGAFLAVLNRCVRPRGPAPPVALVPGAGHTLLVARLRGAALALGGEDDAPPGAPPVVMPASALAALLDAPGEGPVGVGATARRGELRRGDRRVPF